MTTQEILQGVHDWTNGKIVYDISVAHPDGQGNPTKYADLTAALGTGGANIPEALRKGGMSVKFVLSSDNKYVQFRCISDEFTTDVTKWQGIDKGVTERSPNLLESGGLYEDILSILNQTMNTEANVDLFKEMVADGYFYGYLTSNGTWDGTTGTTYETKYYAVNKGDILLVSPAASDTFARYGFFKMEPNSSATPDMFIPNNPVLTTPIIIIAPDDGYISVSNGRTYVHCKKLKSYLHYNFLNTIPKWEAEKDIAVGDIIQNNDNLYISKSTFTEGNTFTSSNYFKISVSEAYGIMLLLRIKNALHLKKVDSFTNFTTGYLTRDGVFTSANNNYGLGYFQVNKGDIIHIDHNGAGLLLFGVGFFNSAPTINSTPVYVEKVMPLPWHNNFIVSPIDGYVLLPAMTTRGASLVDNINDVIESLKKLIPILPADITPVSNQGYLIGTGSTKGEIGGTTYPQFHTSNYRILAGKTYVLKCDLQNAYAKSNSGAWLVGYGLNTTLRTTNGVIDYYYDMYENNKDEVTIKPTSDTYLIINDGSNNNMKPYFRLFEQNPNGWEYIADKFIEEDRKIEELTNQYQGKKCLYIGDSISTKDLYDWKGLIENAYKLSYVRDLTGQLAPASGGIRVMPREDESETELSAKTIWYRCAENRMSIYDFDIISLFGGTNDMVTVNLPIGTIDDKPYVDDASSFANPSAYTDVWSNDLTFAQCLMGCIKMLQRDFPNKEIILCTVLPCGASYGNWTDSVSGLIGSEAMAELQVRVANKYNLKVVPFYWNVRTVQNADNRTFSKDTVHPNLPCALRMRAVFAEILCL